MADEKVKKVEEENKNTDKKTTTTNKATETNKKESKPEATAKVETKKETTKAEVKTEKAEAKKEKKIENNSEELVAKATVKYARISSRKVAVVANLIRGKNVDEAMAILKFTPKAGTEILIKLLKSAIANAENNNLMNHSKLYIAEIYSNQGPTMKRIRPAAKGSAVRIRKRTSNTTIVLKERD